MSPILRKNVDPSRDKLDLSGNCVCQHDNDPKHSLKIRKKINFTSKSNPLDHDDSNHDNPVGYLWQISRKRYVREPLQLKKTVNWKHITKHVPKILHGVTK